MRIPRQLKIGGHIIKIDCNQELENSLGDTQLNKNLIRISKELPQDQKEATLIHEIFHCINTTCNDGIGHILIDSLSEQLYQVLKDNKLLR